MRKDDMGYMSELEKENVAKHRRIKLTVKWAIALVLFWAYVGLAFYAAGNKIRISEVKNIVTYALNGFKYVPEEESQEWIDTVKGYGWYLDEPDNYRDDGHLFNYGDYDINDDEVTYDDLKEIMEKKEQCTLYGHYTKIDARDFMDQFFLRCKEKGIDIMYVPRHGDIDLRLDDVFTKYEVKDVFETNVNDIRSVEINWDIGSGAIHSIKINGEYGDNAFFETQLNDDNSEFLTEIQIILDLLGDADLTEAGTDSVKDLLNDFIEQGESVKWDNRNMSVATGDITEIGKWEVTPAMRTSGHIYRGVARISITLECTDMR